MIGSYHKGSKDYLPLYLVEVSFWHNNQKNAGIYVEGVTGCGGRASTVLSQSRNKFLPPYKKRYSYTMGLSDPVAVTVDTIAPRCIGTDR